MGIREDFVKFLNSNNLVVLAIAFVVGTAVAAVVTALVTDLVTPLIGALIHVDFSQWRYTLNGSVFLQGAFVNSLIDFLVVLSVVFFVIALPYQRYQARKNANAPATTRACPECLTQIPVAAKRCSACTSPVPPVPAPKPSP